MPTQAGHSAELRERASELAVKADYVVAVFDPADLKPKWVWPDARCVLLLASGTKESKAVQSQLTLTSALRAGTASARLELWSNSTFSKSFLVTFITKPWRARSQL